MRRPAHLTFLAAATALLTACGGAGSGESDEDVVATVDGEEISASQVDELTSEPPEGAEGEDAEGEGDEAALASRRQALSLLIPDLVITAVTEEAGVEIGEDDLAQAREQLVAGLGGEDQLGPALSQAGLSEAVVDDILVPQQARVLALSEQLAQGETLTTRTVRHIMVASQEEAAEVDAELDGGADFAELAAERSTDTQSAEQGGELPAAPQGALPPGLDEAVWEAELEEVVGPVESQSGFHVFEVLAEDSVPGEELEADQVGQLAGPQLQELVGTALSEAEVEVDEELGAWDPAQQAVVPADQVGQPPAAPGQQPPPAPEGEQGSGGEGSGSQGQGGILEDD